MASHALPPLRAWPRPEQGRRRRLAAGLLAAVLAVHAWLLGGARPPGAAARPAPATAPAAVQVRQILVAPVEVTAPVEATAAAPAPRPARPGVRSAPTTPAPAPDPSASVASPPAISAASAASASAESAAFATPATGEPPPRYATRLPPSQRLHYTLERGAQQGHATLHWQQGDDGYRLVLDGDFGRDRAGRSSRGTLDGDGLAPERYVETRRGREQRAVNFQRNKALITFSAAVHGQPLWPAAQDRLSWLVQIAAALEADATLREPGSLLRLFVAGPRGEAETWTFELRGREVLDLPAGTVADALHLRREPPRPWEPQVDLWLDPARHHLPVRLRWLVRPTGETTELLLLRAEPAP